VSPAFGVRIRRSGVTVRHSEGAVRGPLRYATGPFQRRGPRPNNNEYDTAVEIMIPSVSELCNVNDARTYFTRENIRKPPRSVTASERVYPATVSKRTDKGFANRARKSGQIPYTYRSIFGNVSGQFAICRRVLPIFHP